MNNIRNFCIIAHIDHGKSTLADRLLEITNTVPKRLMQEQLLDSMELERERGITIRSKTIRMEYNYNAENYVLNLIDTPGHVDFTYEVMRVMNACEGAILVVDVSQGVEAQTLANTFLAKKSGLKIIPVLNKIDLPGADVDRTILQIQESLNIEIEPIPVSAKTGYNVEKILYTIIKEFPESKVYELNFMSALVFDAYYDSYRGVVMYVKVLSGKIFKDMQFKFSTVEVQKVYKVEELGYIRLNFDLCKELVAGEVGYVVAGVKDIHQIKIGDIISEPGIEKSMLPSIVAPEIKPYVFAGIYPLSPKDYDNLKMALQKLHLMDYSLSYKPTSSKVLGGGFHCGFLGSLHMDIVKERLEREYNLDLIVTIPNVEYKILKRNQIEVIVDNPSDFPEPSEIEKVFEPITKTTVVTPLAYLSSVIETCKLFRAEVVDQNFIDENRVIVVFEIPLAELIVGFFDAIKSVSKGYASFDYEQIGYKEGDLVKLEVLVNSEPVDSFSLVVHESKAHSLAVKVLEKLKKTIPRHLFTIPLQVKCQNKIIAREDIQSLRKDVIAKCYGGDITRKRKLLEKQKEGKKKMKSLGNVDIPKETFIELLKIDRS